ncbi:Bromodomain and PHD finger-containing protein 1 [Mortierella sp. GBA39]|nr:Bromodomain and PHD finger-containing protein 1 [Mortierella sp. GBA39]
MGAARSPPPPDLDPPLSSDTSSYTHRSSAKRKSSSSSTSRTAAAAEEDYYHYNNNTNDHDASSSRDRKKKKKNKKERRSDYYDYDNSNSNDHDQDRYHDYGQHEAATPPPPPQSASSSRPVIKLPPLKISLKLSSIAPPSSSVSSSHKSSSSSKKKRRSSEQINIVSDDEDDINSNDYDNDEQEADYSYRRRQSSVDQGEDQDMDAPQSSSHKKKKKHKHKHRHRHPKHEDQDAEESHQHRPQQHYEQEPAEVGNREEMEEEDVGGYDTPRITMRPGKEKKKKSRRSSSHRSHPSHPSDEAGHHYQQPTLPPPQQSKARSRSRSVSQSNGDVSLSIKQEEPPVQPTYQEPVPAHPHSQLGMKKPRSALQSMVTRETVVSQDEDEDLDDPLAGELDEPEDDDDDEEEDDEEEGDESDNGELTSPILDPGTNAQFGSKTVRAGQMGSKTLPPSASASNSKKARKPSVAKEAKEGKDTAESTPREGSVPESTRGGRKGKGSKRHLTPRTTTPAIPKKKELSVVCHKLLDNFIKRDSYVLFSQPVDPTVVLDYATIIKNPMDFSTMRSKVERNFYPTIDEFLSDFQLVCDNARLYNAKETLYWRQADKLWDWGSRAIERERKTILDRDEEVLRTVKDEETLDVGGMGDYSGNNGNGGGGGTANGLPSRGSFMSVEPAVDSPMSIADSGRSHTPQQYRKTKKIKHRRDGTIAFTYASDGSIDPASHPDPWSLIPVQQEFGSPPSLRPLLDTISSSYNGQYLDDYPYWKPPTTGSRPAGYLDYGPYAIMDKSPVETDGSSSVNLPVFTGMVFGDDTGEAYVRSLAMFMEGIVDVNEVSQMTESDAAGLLQVKEHIRKKVEKLTRGASTIADKVAAIVLEEKTGQPSDVDTRVPKALWQQDFDTEMDDATQTTTTTAPLEEKVGLNKDISKDDSQDMQIDQPTEPEDAVMKDAIVPSEGREAEATAAATATDAEFKDAEVKTEEKSGLQQPVKDQRGEEKPGVRMASIQAEPEMIDIRQVVRDIKAWPQAQKVKADYESWRQLKIELDSLLPLAPADEKVKIEWGQNWTGGDSEESKKWVRESLEKNSADMRKVVELVAAKTAEDQAAKTLTEATAESTTAEDKRKAVKDKDVEVVTLSDDDKALVQRLTKSVRERLAEMAKYVPLSEINPQKLPPPPAPPVPTPAPATPTPAAAVPVAVTPAAPASVATPAAPATPAMITPAAASPSPTPTASPVITASSSAVTTLATSQDASVTTAAPTAPIIPTVVAAPAAVTLPSTLSTPAPTTATTTAQAMEAPKPASTLAPVPTSVATPALISPAVTEAKAPSSSTAALTVTTMAPLNTPTTTETATAQSSAASLEPNGESTAATPAPEPEALSESKPAVAVAVAAPVLVDPSEREGSASSLSSPGSSP